MITIDPKLFGREVRYVGIDARERGIIRGFSDDTILDKDSPSYGVQVLVERIDPKGRGWLIWWSLNELELEVSEW